MIQAAKSDEFYMNYRADIKSSVGTDWEVFSLRISTMQSALIRQLSQSGLQESEQFDIGWNLNESYFVYGTILDPGYIHAGLVPAVLQAFSDDSEPTSWVCHFVIENTGLKAGNQFYIKGNGDIVIEEEEGWESIRDKLQK